MTIMMNINDFASFKFGKHLASVSRKLHLLILFLSLSIPEALITCSRQSWQTEEHKKLNKN